MTNLFIALEGENPAVAPVEQPASTANATTSTEQPAPGADATAEQAKPEGSMWPTIIMMVLIFVVMWLFMIRPQQKQQKELNKFRNALAKGQKIVTAGGIYGTVKEVKENYVLMEVDNNCTIRVDKSAIMRDPSDK